MHIADIDVAVLAGGLGTRLRGVLPETPKILAPIGGKPFLEHLLGWLSRQGARRVLLCLGYRAADVLSFLDQRSFSPLEIETVIESQPLGTAGAVAYARPRFRTDPVLVMNGDTIIDADLNVFLSAHHDSRTEASILCVQVANAGRYGHVEIGADRRVIRFVEKDATAGGTAWINGGVYLFGGPILQRIAKLAKGSLECDVLANVPAGRIFAFQTEGRFLDIGTPETLALAPEVLAAL
jgi:NDP-sugar pyrophosphorylase family protein